MAGFLPPITRQKFIMRTFKTELDHIDPRWKEGRDYQLVCGLDCPLNYREEDARKNTAKSNRFLPWRRCRDEIGVVPAEPGDLAYFLVGADIENDVPGEWVLMEFLSEEWFEATRHTCGSYQDHFQERSKIKKWREENPEKVEEQLYSLIEGSRKWRQNNKEEFQGVTRKAQEGAREWEKNNPEGVKKRMKAMKEGKQRWLESNREVVSENSKQQAKRRYKCKITGYISTAQWVTIHQRKLGIEPIPENREEITE